LIVIHIPKKIVGDFAPEISFDIDVNNTAVNDLKYLTQIKNKLFFHY
jgi:hypothetical protein